MSGVGPQGVWFPSKLWTQEKAAHAWRSETLKCLRQKHKRKVWIHTNFQFRGRNAAGSARANFTITVVKRWESRAACSELLAMSAAAEGIQTSIELPEQSFLHKFGCSLPFAHMTLLQRVYPSPNSNYAFPSDKRRKTSVTRQHKRADRCSRFLHFMSCFQVEYFSLPLTL